MPSPPAGQGELVVSELPLTDCSVVSAAQTLWAYNLPLHVVNDITYIIKRQVHMPHKPETCLWASEGSVVSVYMGFPLRAIVGKDINHFSSLFTVNFQPQQRGDRKAAWHTGP